MRCPFCGAQDTRVIDSRLSQEGDQVRRRRECVECKDRFTTYEVVELNMPWVVKNNGHREPFYEEKLRAGILRALEKRPVSGERIETLLSRVKREILACGDREISSRQIGEALMRELSQIDHVAYVRFASVYRSFQDVDQFRQVIDGLKGETESSER